MKPMYALHKDRDGQILAAGSFAYDFELGKFIREMDVRPGDSIHFGEAVKRDAEVEEAPEPAPAFLTDPLPAAPELAADEQPF